MKLLRNDFFLGGWRAEAIHMKGIKGLNKKEIMDYFQDYQPQYIESVDSDSCKSLNTSFRLFNFLFTDLITPLLSQTISILKKYIF